MKKGLVLVLIPAISILVVGVILMNMTSKDVTMTAEQIKLMNTISMCIIALAVLMVVFAICAKNKFFYSLAMILGLPLGLSGIGILYIVGVKKIRDSALGNESSGRLKDGAKKAGIVAAFLSWRFLLLLLCFIPAAAVLSLYVDIYKKITVGDFSFFSTWVGVGVVIALIDWIVRTVAGKADGVGDGVSSPGQWIVSIIINVLLAPLFGAIVSIKLIIFGFRLFVSGMEGSAREGGGGGGRKSSSSGSNYSSSGGSSGHKNAFGLENELSRACSEIQYVGTYSRYGANVSISCSHSVSYGSNTIVFNIRPNISYNSSRLGSASESSVKDDVNSIVQSIYKKAVDIGSQAVQRAREKFDGYDDAWSVDCKINPSVNAN